MHTQQCLFIYSHCQRETKVHCRIKVISTGIVDLYNDANKGGGIKLYINKMSC